MINPKEYGESKGKMPIKLDKAEEILKLERKNKNIYYRLRKIDKERVHEIELMTEPFDLDTTLKVRLAERIAEKNRTDNCEVHHTLYNFGRFDEPKFRDVIIATVVGVIEEDLKRAIKSLRSVKSELFRCLRKLEKEEVEHIDRLMKSG